MIVTNPLTPNMEAPVWVKVASPKRVRVGKPGYLAPGTLDVQVPLATDYLSNMMNIFHKPSSPRKPRLWVRFGESSHGNALESWVSDHAKFVQPELVSGPIEVEISYADPAQTWAWFAANRWDEVVGIAWEKLPAENQCDRLELVTSSRLPFIPPYLAEQLRTALHPLSRSEEEAEKAFPRRAKWQYYSVIPAYVVGTSVGGPLMTFSRAIAYEAAGVGAAEARLVEFGEGQRTPSLETLASLAALNGYDWAL